MMQLTRQQQAFLCVVLLLLLAGWTVRAWRSNQAGPVPVAATPAP
ncbi:MAG: hypothetical protein RJA22_1242 [Verrucomicrobiota bacterium]|jgi:hypothetical protein